MSFQTLTNKKKILEIADHLIRKKQEIRITIKGDDTLFISKCIHRNQDTTSRGEGKHELIIDKMEPDKGNTLIQSASHVKFEFMIKSKVFRCSTEFLGISSTPPHFGFILGLPERLEVEEKRIDERYTYDMPDFVAAEFSLEKGTNEEKRYELSVLDCSCHGLGLLVTKDDFDLFKKMKRGDKIEEITIFATWSMIRIDGIVKHITRIHKGKHKDCYMFGIESKSLIKNCKPDRT